MCVFSVVIDLPLIERILLIWRVIFVHIIDDQNSLVWYEFDSYIHIEVD